jgi:translation elongation factor EF-1beta
MILFKVETWEIAFFNGLKAIPLKIMMNKKE